MENFSSSRTPRQVPGATLVKDEFASIHPLKRTGTIRNQKYFIEFDFGCKCSAKEKPECKKSLHPGFVSLRIQQSANAPL
jgi:hypothetical protein